tara:strand:+ start:762 stop:1409 length:648 start_codon:yes stop_codon:yes gene_type:complete
MYPNFTIVDNFLNDPDYAVEISNQIEYRSSPDGRWPGKRSAGLHLDNRDFFYHVCNKIFSIFYESEPDYWHMSLEFQKILPYDRDQYDKKNRGWVHADMNCQFGGVIYLNKNPEPDTGTSMYQLKNDKLIFDNDIKEKFYRGEMSSEENLKYQKNYDKMNERYVETVNVKNVYNRLVLIDGKTWHAAQTFGTKERLTLCFFAFRIDGKTQPMFRY